MVLLWGQPASNLLGKAITCGAPDQPIRMGVMAIDGQFELLVANAGAPIPPAALAKIFEPFTRGTAHQGRHGASREMAASGSFS